MMSKTGFTMAESLWRACIVGTLLMTAFLPATARAALERARAQQDQPAPTPPKAKRVKNDTDLARRLIHKTVHESDEDVMANAIRLMNQAARKLEIEFDAGDETQALQRRITDRLDEAIKIAAAQRRPMRSRRPGASGDKRKMPEGAVTGPRNASRADGKPGQAASSGTAPARNGAADRTTGGDLRERRRSWGQLPRRQREEIIQGAAERFLERYRAWIERYYRALQEADE